MQRRDARSFFEEVLAKVPNLPAAARDQLLEIVADKPGNKRASKLAAALAAVGPVSGEAAPVVAEPEPEPQQPAKKKKRGAADHG